jgi:hypothetical protein
MCERFKGEKNRSAIFLSSVSLRTYSCLWGTRARRCSLHSWHCHHLHFHSYLQQHCHHYHTIARSWHHSWFGVRPDISTCLFRVRYNYQACVVKGGKIGRDTKSEFTSASMYASEFCFGQICRQAVSYKRCRI